MKSKSTLQQSLWISSLILAPLLLSISQFYWQNGVVTIPSGVLAFLIFGLWIFAFQAMFHLVENKMPRYAVAGFFVAVYSCIAGNNFGMEGIYGSIAGVTDLEKLDQFRESIGGAVFIFLLIPGLLFPLSLLVLGINLIRTKSISFWAGIVLCIGAVLFPLSRVPRIEILAHLDNAFLLLSHCMIAFQLMNAKRQARTLNVATV